MAGRSKPSTRNCRASCAKLRPGDLLVLTADHGNDPTWTGTDHTREQVPVMSYMRGMTPGSFGLPPSFADIGQTIAHGHLGVGPLAAAGTGVGRRSVRPLQHRLQHVADADGADEPVFSSKIATGASRCCGSPA